MSLLGTYDINDITADALLAITDSEPEKLFTTANADQVKKEYRQLAKLWHYDLHPDNPKANEVMQRIQALYEKANDKITRNNWEIPNLFRFETTDHKKFQIRYLKKQPFELGDMYVADASVTYVLNKNDKALFENAKKVITSLNYPNDDMKTKFKGVLPEIKRTFETSDKLIMVINKNPEDILLSDALQHVGKFDPKHAAWMMSRLHNVSCYLEWSGLTHNAINSETCFINPVHHGISLLGGWWYAAPKGEKLKALPPKTVSLAPPSLFDKPVADPKLDLSLIRATAREALGDANGMSLYRDTNVPKPFTEWVNGVSSGDARRDYKIWSEEILSKSFGARRFVELKLSPNDIYKP